MIEEPIVSNLEDISANTLKMTTPKRLGLHYKMLNKRYERKKLSNGRGPKQDHTELREKRDIL